MQKLIKSTRVFSHFIDVVHCPKIFIPIKKAKLKCLILIFFSMYKIPWHIFHSFYCIFLPIANFLTCMYMVSMELPEILFFALIHIFYQFIKKDLFLTSIISIINMLLMKTDIVNICIFKYIWYT